MHEGSVTREYQGIVPPQKNSSDMMKVARFFHTVVSTKNEEKLVEKRTGDDGEDVEHISRKTFQCFHV